MNPRLYRLEVSFPPPAFLPDFTSSSLDALEAALLDRFDQPGDLHADDAWGLVDAAVGYLGESLLRVAGGAWAWRDEAPGSAGGVPVARLAVSGEDVSPLDLVTRSVRVRSGHVLSGARGELEKAVRSRIAADPSWRPVKEPTPGVDEVEPPRSAYLESWRSERERRFPHWAATFGGTGSWDFSPGSLDLLEARLFDIVGSEPALFTAEHHDFVDGAVWYLGETLIRTGGGTWRYNEGEIVPGNPWVGRPYVKVTWKNGEDAAVPVLSIQRLLRRRDAGSLRRRLETFGP
jgi:hypothetical protein